MITSIEIENFRGIQQGKLVGLTPLTVLVGPNGCGKSTILDALLLGGSNVPSEAIRQLAEQRQRLNHGARWLIYKASAQNNSLIDVRSSDGDRRLIELQSVPTDQGQRKVAFSLLPPWTKDQADSFIEIGSISTSSYGLVSGSHPVSGITDAVLVDLSRTAQNLPLHQLLSRAVIEGRRSDVNATIRAVLPGLDHIEILTEGDAPILHLVYSSYSVPAALSGDGIHDLLRLCLELAARPDGVVLLEEPEVHQHPRALRQSALAILAAVRRGIQVVLTTHSLELIDYLISETESDEDLGKVSVIRLQLTDGCLKSVVLSGGEASFSRAQLQDDLR